MSHNVILEAFGEECNLYTDVLNCTASVDAAGLRKAYYRAALRFHPDKNPGDTAAASKFQAVTAAYRILQDPDQRTAYDETGEFGGGDDDDDMGSSSGKTNPWREYFDGIFGRVTTSGIDAFAQKYKCSDEERKDVLQAFMRCKGNLVSMLEVVLLSEARDAPRWVQDYIQPAIDAGEIKGDFTKAMSKSLVKCKKKVEKEKEDEEDDKDADTDATESEEDVPSPGKKRASPEAKKPKKKKAKKNDDMTDLIAQIQKRRGGGASSLASRYGVEASNLDDDPLADDEAFAKAQSKLLKRR